MSEIKPRIKEIIVVEGRDDERAIKEAVRAEVIITNGYHIGKETLSLIKKAYEGPGVVIFTDPDSAGESIRRRLTKEYPHSKQAFLIKEDAVKGDDIGIENARSEAIRKALEKVVALREIDAGAGDSTKDLAGTKNYIFTREDMLYFSLIGSEDSSKRRSKMGKALGIGYANGKTFLARLNGFGITREEFYLNGHTLFTGHCSEIDKGS